MNKNRFLKRWGNLIATIAWCAFWLTVLAVYSALTSLGAASAQGEKPTTLQVTVTVERGNFGPLQTCVSGVVVMIGDDQFLLGPEGGVASASVKNGTMHYVSAAAYHTYATKDPLSGASGQVIAEAVLKISLDGDVEMTIPLRPAIRFVDEAARQADCEK